METNLWDKLEAKRNARHTGKRSGVQSWRCSRRHAGRQSGAQCRGQSGRHRGEHGGKLSERQGGRQRGRHAGRHSGGQSSKLPGTRRTYAEGRRSGDAPQLLEIETQRLSAVGSKRGQVKSRTRHTRRHIKARETNKETFGGPYLEGNQETNEKQSGNDFGPRLEGKRTAIRKQWGHHICKTNAAASRDRGETASEGQLGSGRHLEALGKPILRS